MMKDSQRTMLELVRAAIWDEEPSSHLLPCDASEWKEVLTECRKQAVLESVIPVIFRIQEANNKPDKQQVEWLEDCYMENLRDTQVHSKAITKVFRSMEGKGCHPVLLKGLGNASLYNELCRRRCGDIDIYVRVDEYRFALDALKSFASEEEINQASLEGEHYNITIGGIDFELHYLVGSTLWDWDMRKEMMRLGRKWLDKKASLCETITLGTTPVRIPPVYYNAVFLFVHAMKHVGHGLGLRHLADIALFLHKHEGEIDEMQLLGSLNRMNLLNEWQQMGYILVKYINLPSHEFPFYSEENAGKADELFASVLEYGNFGLSKAGKSEEPPAPHGFWKHPIAHCRETYIYYTSSYLMQKALYGRSEAQKNIVKDFWRYQLTKIRSLFPSTTI